MTDAERLREIAEHILTTLNGSERVEDSRELRRIAVALDEREVIWSGWMTREDPPELWQTEDVAKQASLLSDSAEVIPVSLVRRQT